MIQMKNEQGESYTEVLTILNYMETEYQQKIPKKLIDFFKRNSAKDYKFDIDLAIPLKEQKLKDKTLSILAILNLNYWCENEVEKQELIKKYSENEKRIKCPAIHSVAFAIASSTLYFLLLTFTSYSFFDIYIYYIINIIY